MTYFKKQTKNNKNTEPKSRKKFGMHFGMQLFIDMPKTVHVRQSVIAARGWIVLAQVHAMCLFLSSWGASVSKHKQSAHTVYTHRVHSLSWLLQQTIIHNCFYGCLVTVWWLLMWSEEKDSWKAEGSVGFMHFKSTYLKGHFMPRRYRKTIWKSKIRGYTERDREIDR